MLHQVYVALLVELNCKFTTSFFELFPSQIQTSTVLVKRRFGLDWKQTEHFLAPSCRSCGLFGPIGNPNGPLQFLQAHPHAEIIITEFLKLATFIFFWFCDSSKGVFWGGRQRYKMKMTKDFDGWNLSKVCGNYSEHTSSSHVITAFFRPLH